MPASQPDFSDGSMLALYPPPAIAEALAIPGGLEPADLHVTIAYCGDASGVRKRLLRRAAAAIASQVPPFTAAIAGHARFTGGDQDVIVALADGRWLEDLRSLALAELETLGIDVPREHSFTPHMTLAYLDRRAPDPVGRLQPVTIAFPYLAAVHGTKARRFPFTAQDGQQAIARYVTGWTSAGVQVTPEVLDRAALAAATATAHPHAGSASEVTLKLGQLDGTWAQWHQRREARIDAGTAEVVAAFTKAAGELHVPGMVARYRTEAITPGRALDPLLARQVAATAAAGLMAGLYASRDYHALTGALRAALAGAMAEAQASAVMLAGAGKPHGEAYPAGLPGWDAMYAAFLARLEDLPSLPLMAQEWVQQISRSAGQGLANLLARLAAENATEPDMVAAVRTALTSSATTGTVLARAVAAFTDQAMTQAMTQASLALYQAEGQTSYSFLTAGDERVCPQCEDAKAGSPYTVGDGPEPGLHPSCRCTVTPDSPLDYADLVSRYFSQGAS